MIVVVVVVADADAVESPQLPSAASRVVQFLRGAASLAESDAFEAVGIIALEELRESPDVLKRVVSMLTRSRER